MGLFSSRPSYHEIETHIAFSCNVNDAFFHEPRIASAADCKELLSRLWNKDELAFTTAKEYIASLRGQIGRAQQRLDNMSQDTLARLVIEIRKGVDILPFGVRRARGVYIAGKTSPAELKFKTDLGQPFIPKWYHLSHIPFNPKEEVLTASLTIYCVNSRNEEVAIASCEVDLREAIDTTMTRWHMFSWIWPFDSPQYLPQVEIRFWLLKSPEVFWTNIKSRAMEELATVESAVTNSRERPDS